MASVHPHTEPLYDFTLRWPSLSVFSEICSFENDLSTTSPLYSHWWTDCPHEVASGKSEGWGGSGSAPCSGLSPLLLMKCSFTHKMCQIAHPHRFLHPLLDLATLTTGNGWLCVYACAVPFALTAASTVQCRVDIGWQTGALTYANCLPTVGVVQTDLMTKTY